MKYQFYFKGRWYESNSITHIRIMALDKLKRNPKERKNGISIWSNLIGGEYGNVDYDEYSKTWYYSPYSDKVAYYTLNEDGSLGHATSWATVKQRWARQG